MLLGTLVFRPYVVLTALITEEKEHTVEAPVVREPVHLI